MDDVQAATHIGICVSDLERSSRFYCDGLGFERVQALTAGDQFRRLMELEAEVVLEVQLLRRDGLTIELLWFRSPGSIGPRDRRPMNQLGFTHLSFRVANIDTVANCPSPASAAPSMPIPAPSQHQSEGCEPVNISTAATLMVSGSNSSAETGRCTTDWSGSSRPRAIYPVTAGPSTVAIAT